MADAPELLQNFHIADHEMQALEGAHALLVVTEWKNFHNPDFEAIKQALRIPLIVDGRNLYNPEALMELGLAYQGIGRRNDLVSTVQQTVASTRRAVLPEQERLTPALAC
jgi:UDPglucose 6-dehydrogenase